MYMYMCYGLYIQLTLSLGTEVFQERWKPSVAAKTFLGIAGSFAAY